MRVWLVWLAWLHVDNDALGTAEPARLLPRGEAREPSIGGRRSCSRGLTSGTPVGGRLAPVGKRSR